MTLESIQAARERIAGRVLLSPCSYSESLTRVVGAACYLKLENLQRTGSFKERGACNKLSALTPEERARGVICASAGNHAQGVAYHAQRLGIDATIVMPERSPLVKVQNTRNFGARVVLAGSSYDEAAEVAENIRQTEQRVFVHPFNDEAIIAGQGTIGLEILEQVPDVEAVVVAIGGGGLVAGVGTAIRGLRPDVKVFGVQTKALPSMRDSIAEGAPVTLPAATTMAEGIAVRRPGAITLEIAKRTVEEIAVVDDEEIAEAILMLLEREKTVAEGAGAASVAAVLQERLPIRGKRTVVILCGGNIDVTLMSRIIDRGLVKSGRLFRFSVRVPDVAGSLARLATLVAETRANILQIHHDRAFAKAELSDVVVELVVETRGFPHIAEVESKLAAAGYLAMPK